MSRVRFRPQAAAQSNADLIKGTYTRDMTFTADGRVCTSNNPIPPPALEGGVLEIICIDPNYQPRHEARLALGQD